mmetsp:Transcript_934/g.1902  ORF Transcript_934/g.1902 Transcript_934/m.1902 type:complete len:230 (+) Transcript_934:741-1430(+)
MTNVNVSVVLTHNETKEAKVITYRSSWRNYWRSARRYQIIDLIQAALVPNKAVQEAVEKILPLLGDEFGCMHVRLEEENLKGGKKLQPPNLEQMHKHMSGAPELLQAQKIFVMVPPVQSESEAALLAQPTPWGADMVQVPRDVYQSLSYMENMLLLLQVCRKASWFAGYSHSTFSMKMAEYRRIDKNEGWHNVCAWGLIRLQPGQGYHCVHRGTEVGKKKSPPGAFKMQ